MMAPDPAFRDQELFIRTRRRHWPRLIAVSPATIILGLGAGYLCRRLKLPGLVGPLLVGILVGPHLLGLLRPEMMALAADFRKTTLIVIFLRAGFELRRDPLNRTARRPQVR